MARVLVCDAMAEDPLDEIRACDYLDLTYDPEVSPEGLLTAVKGMQALVVRSRTKVTKEVIDAFDEMKLIVRAGVGVDNIDVPYAKEKGYEVRNTPAAPSVSVAELAIGMMFALARGLPAATRSMQDRKWEKKKFKGIELWQKTLGIVGIGRIGYELAKRAVALGMTVLFYDPYIKQEDITEFRAKKVLLDELLAQSDFVSVHVPHNDQTHHMINADSLAKMKPTAYVLNCARGGVVDEPALADALREGKLAGVGLDVYEHEPAQDHAFADFENVVLTPHIGSQTAEAQSRVGFEVVEILKDYFSTRGSE